VRVDLHDSTLDELERSIPVSAAATAAELGLPPGSVAADGRSTYASTTGEAGVAAARIAELQHAVAVVQADTEARLAAARAEADGVAAVAAAAAAELQAEVARLQAATDQERQEAQRALADEGARAEAAAIDRDSAMGEASRLQAALSEERATVERLQDERLQGVSSDVAAEIAGYRAQLVQLQAGMEARQQEVVSGVVALRRMEARAARLEGEQAALQAALDEARRQRAATTGEQATLAAYNTGSAGSAIAPTITAAAAGLPAREEQLQAALERATEVTARCEQLEELLAEAEVEREGAAVAAAVADVTPLDDATTGPNLQVKPKPKFEARAGRKASGKPKLGGKGAAEAAGSQAAGPAAAAAPANGAAALPQLQALQAELAETQAKLAKAEAGPPPASLVVQKAEKAVKDAERRVDMYKKQDAAQKEEIARLANAVTLVEKGDARLKAELKATRAELISLTAVAAESVGAAEALAESQRALRALMAETKLLQDSCNQERILRKKYYNTIEVEFFLTVRTPCCCCCVLRWGLPPTATHSSVVLLSSRHGGTAVAAVMAV